MVGRHRAWALAALLGATPAAAQAPQPESFETVYTRAKEAFAAGEFLKAADLLERAYSLRPDARLMWNIGRSLEAVGEYERAIDAYERYLAGAPDDSERKSAMERLVSCKVAFGKGWLSVSADAEGARVSVDGGEAAAAPLKRALLATGTHEVVIRADGRKDVKAVVTVVPGEVVELAVELPALPVEVPVVETPVVTDPVVVEVGTPMRDWGWATIGAGGALIAGGATLVALGFADKGTVDDAERDGTGAIVGLSRAEALELEQSAEAKSAAGIALLVGGGAALATGVVLLLIGDEPQSVWVAPGAAGAVIGGRF
ncbi:MAG: hypothetical protein AMXMBFR64_32360 [Myxococcales bacterium]